jgi:hypothetical protein
MPALLPITIREQRVPIVSACEYASGDHFADWAVSCSGQRRPNAVRRLGEAMTVLSVPRELDLGEIVSGDVSGGTNTSHTIALAALETLLDAVPSDADGAAYTAAVLEANVLGKQTESARKRSFRYLRELYRLRPSSMLFRALRDLWSSTHRRGHYSPAFARKHETRYFAPAALRSLDPRLATH